LAKPPSEAGSGAPVFRNDARAAVILPAVTDTGEPLPGLIEAYEQTALQWGQLQSDSAKANGVFEENHSIYKSLRNHEEGRVAIARLMTHDSEAVRLLAATHSLAWEPEVATATLDAIERAGGLPGVTANYTLRSYRAGQLNLDW